MIRSIFVGSKLRRLVLLQPVTWDQCTIRVQAFREFASANRYPILIHCTQGKDRTGLLVALILLLLDVPLDSITYDYCLSESELLPEQESRLREIKEIGLTEEFAKTPRNWIPELHRHLGWKYGGVRGYLSKIGVDGETQDRVVDVLRP
jgi:protein-tyrosine phosphatase